MFDMRLYFGDGNAHGMKERFGDDDVCIRPQIEIPVFSSCLSSVSLLSLSSI